MSEQPLVSFIVGFKKFLKTVCDALLNGYHFKKELNVDRVFLKTFNFQSTARFLTFALRYL